MNDEHFSFLGVAPDHVNHKNEHSYHKSLNPKAMEYVEKNKQFLEDIYDLEVC